MKKVMLLGFICGALAILVFHQGTQYVLFHQFAALKSLLGVADAFRPPSPGFSLRAAAPFGLPQVATLAVWGGLWGILLAALIRWAALPDLLTGLLLGGLAWTLVGFSVLPEINTASSGFATASLGWWRTVLLNGAWGWGAAFLMRPFALRGV